MQISIALQWNTVALAVIVVLGGLLSFDADVLPSSCPPVAISIVFSAGQPFSEMRWHKRSSECTSLARARGKVLLVLPRERGMRWDCLLYTSDAADE